MKESSARPTMEAARLRLAPSTTIRDSAALKASLLPLFDCPDAVVIDVTEVETIDTAALQLLFAFARDRHSRALTVQWEGESVGWRAAIVALDPTSVPTVARNHH